MNSQRQKILLATNPAYWPSTGGSEMVLQKILEGCRSLFDRIVVFTHKTNHQTEFHNGIEIRSYSMAGLLSFAIQNGPAVYFPNMIHSPLTYKNIMTVSKLSGMTVCNLIGGYPNDTKLSFRKNVLRKVAKYVDFAIHVDPLSVEYFIDRAINPNIRFTFISQGLDFTELEQALANVSKNETPYFVFAHNLWKWKAPDVFIREIVAKTPDIRFKIIASDKTGDFIKEISKIAPQYKNLQLALGLPRTEFLQVLAGASGVISTSTIEGAQPNVLLESGSLGVPYFSTIPGQNFSHYPHVEMFSSTDEMRNKVIELRDTGYSSMKSKMEESRKFFSANHWKWEYVISEYRKLFSQKLS